jgi:hypothetical protein
MGFKESLRVNPQDLSKSGKKVAIERLKRLIEEQMAYVDENNSFSMYEKTEQMTVFFRMSKILENYDELEPTLKKFFKEKAEKERFER